MKYEFKRHEALNFKNLNLTHYLKESSFEVILKNCVDSHTKLQIEIQVIQRIMKQEIQIHLYYTEFKKIINIV